MRKRHPTCLIRSLHPKVSVIVVAAGSGSRLGQSVPKAFVSLGTKTILDRAIETIQRIPHLSEVVIVVPAENVDDVSEHYQDFKIISGGLERQDSVAAGIEALSECDFILVHDAARPLTPLAQFERVVSALIAGAEAVVPGIAIDDTIKKIATTGEISLTVERDGLVRVQTPQGFKADILKNAYATAEQYYTDDAGLVQNSGVRVELVMGSRDAFKITTSDDLQRAIALSAPIAGPIRVGTGADVHAKSDGGVLQLGCLEWPGEPALNGHSDGDALSHAICDALLSAAGLGDIGAVFGVDDSEYKGASGERFLTETIALLTLRGWKPLSVSAEVIANSPRVAPRRAEIEQRLSDLLKVPVTISGTTSDGLGITGNGEGIAAVASAIITSN
ncbi:MAG: 2-C-methyl-D-erythritol 4-phosphate cytidylyltransferase [Microbacteriaceae bacterium]|nr:2-C-methyl-D-erythritol 4-phosphate cytidylyltransferase [Microbacteriaceae bacterium]